MTTNHTEDLFNFQQKAQPSRRVDRWNRWRAERRRAGVGLHRGKTVLAK